MSESAGDETVSRSARSLTRLARTNFTRFAVQMQHVSDDVQKKVLERLPEFNALAADALKTLAGAHDSNLAATQHAEDQVHRAAEEWRAAARSLLDDPNLSTDDKLRVLGQIGDSARMQADVQAANNRHRARLFASVAVGAAAVAGVVVVAATGGRIGIDRGGDE